MAEQEPMTYKEEREIFQAEIERVGIEKAVLEFCNAASQAMHHMSLLPRYPDECQGSRMHLKDAMVSLAWLKVWIDVMVPLIGSETSILKSKELWAFFERERQQSLAALKRIQNTSENA